MQALIEIRKRYLWNKLKTFYNFHHSSQSISGWTTAKTVLRQESPLLLCFVSNIRIFSTVYNQWTFFFNLQLHWSRLASFTKPILPPKRSSDSAIHLELYRFLARLRFILIYSNAVFSYTHYPLRHLFYHSFHSGHSMFTLHTVHLHCTYLGLLLLSHTLYFFLFTSPQAPTLFA